MAICNVFRVQRIAAAQKLPSHACPAAITSLTNTDQAKPKMIHVLYFLYQGHIISNVIIPGIKPSQTEPNAAQKESSQQPTQVLYEFLPTLKQHTRTPALILEVVHHVHKGGFQEKAVRLQKRV